MTELARARHLAGLYALDDYMDGRVTLSPDSAAKVLSLLRLFVPRDKLFAPTLRLKEAIAELEAQFPEARAAHLTHVAPMVPC